MPWIINALDLLEVQHIAGISPGGKILASTNLRTAIANSGSFADTQNLYSGNPPEISAIITTEDSYTYPGSKTRTQTTRAPANKTIPGATSGGFIIAEIQEQTYTYNSVATSGCVEDILSGSIDRIEITIRRPLGTFASYMKYLADKGITPNPNTMVVVSNSVTTYKYDAKGRTASIIEALYEDPRSLAGTTKGIDWTTTVVSGTQLTKRVIKIWKEVRRGDWEYTYQEYDAWCRTDPNSIPSGTSLARQIEPVLVKSNPKTSTSQNQPPAVERAPAQYSEDTQNIKVYLNFASPSAPFTPRQRNYTFDLVDTTSLFDLGTIAGQHEYGNANQIEVQGAIADEWFSYRPYQSIRIDEPQESGVYAISGMAFTFTQEEFKIGFRGMLVGTISGSDLILPYTLPRNSIGGAIAVPVTLTATAQARASTIGGSPSVVVTGGGTARQKLTIGGSPTVVVTSSGTAQESRLSVGGSPSVVVTSSATARTRLLVGGSPIIIVTSSGNAQNSTDSDAEAFITASGITDSAELAAIRYVVPALKGASLWSLLDAAYPFVGGTTGTCRWNLKDPRDLNAAYRLTFVNSVTTSAGITFSNGYAETNLVPSSVLTLENHHLAYYSGTNNTPSGNDCVDVGAFNSGTQRLLVAGRNKGANSGNPEQTIGAANGAQLSNNSSVGSGFFGIDRNSGTNQLVKDGSVIATGTATGTLPTNSVWIGTIKVSGAPYTPGYSPQRFQWVSIGKALTSTQWAAYDSILRTFQSMLSR